MYVVKVLANFGHTYWSIHPKAYSLDQRLGPVFMVTCISSPKSTKRPDNKDHSKEDPNRLSSKWPHFSWASITFFMG